MASSFKGKMEERKRVRLAEETALSMVEHPGVAGYIGDTLIVVVLTLVALVCAIPLWHVLMSSFSDGQQLLAHSGTVLTPVGGKFNFGGYAYIFQDSSVMLGYLNTLLYVAGGTALGLVMNVVGGYVLSRETKLRGVMTLIVIFTTMFNGG